MLPPRPTVTVEFWPIKSTTKDASTPAAAAMSRANVARKSACSVEFRCWYCKPRSSMVTCALPSAKQELPEQLTQLLSNRAPEE